MSFNEIFEKEEAVKARRVKKMILHLYEYSGMSRTDIHISLKEWMANPPSKERVYDILKGHKRFVNPYPSRKTYAERRRDLYLLRSGGFIKEDFFQGQLSSLHRNYVAHSAVLNNVEPSYFRNEIRTIVSAVASAGALVDTVAHLYYH